MHIRWSWKGWIVSIDWFTQRWKVMHCLMKTYVSSSIFVHRGRNHQKKYQVHLLPFWFHDSSQTGREGNTHYGYFSMKIAHTRGCDLHCMISRGLQKLVHTNKTKRKYQKRLKSFGVQRTNKGAHNVLYTHKVKSTQCWVHISVECAKIWLGIFAYSRLHGF